MTSQVATTVSQAQQQLPVNKIRLGGQLVTGWTPRELKVDCEDGKHDVITLKVLVAEKDPNRWLDSPISLEWGVRGTGLGTFTGYVIAVQKAQEFQKQPLVTLTLMGSTVRLSTGRPRFWSASTTEAIVRSLAAPHRLGVVVDPIPYVWQRFAQTTESDWGTITKAARGVSFMVCSYEGVIRLVDPLRALQSRTSVARLMKSTNTFDANALLLDFVPSGRSRSDRVSPDPTWSYLSAMGVARSVRPDGDHFFSDRYIPDAARARLEEEAAERDTAVWNYNATARLRGNAKVYVGSVVEVATGLSNSSVDTNDGMWLVTQTSTILSDTTYQMDTVLVRDKPRPGTQVRAEPFWGRRSRPGMRLSGDNWVSSWQDVG